MSMQKKLIKEANWQSVIDSGLMPKYTQRDIEKRFNDGTRQWLSMVLYDLNHEERTPKFRFVSYNRIDLQNRTSLHVLEFEFELRFSLVKFREVVKHTIQEEDPVHVIRYDNGRVFVIQYQYR